MNTAIREDIHQYLNNLFEINFSKELFSKVIFYQNSKNSIFILSFEKGNH